MIVTTKRTFRFYAGIEVIDTLHVISHLHVHVPNFTAIQNLDWASVNP